MSTQPSNQSNERRAANSKQLSGAQLRLENSLIKFEVGPVGTIARIERDDGTCDYAGPLNETTIAALLEVAK